MFEIMNNIILFLQNRRLWQGLIILFVIINIVLFLYIFIGFGTIKIEPGNYDTVYINNNPTTKTSLKLRPGTYTIRFEGKDVSTSENIISILPLQTKVVTAKKSDPLTLINEAYNLPPVDGEYNLIESKYIEDDIWLVAKYTRKDNDNRLIVVYRYIAGSWRAILYHPNEYSADTYAELLDLLPNTVMQLFDEYRVINDED